MKLKLIPPTSPALFRCASGIIHFEGEIFHAGEPPPESVFLRIGPRIVRLRRIAQTPEKTFFRGRFTMRTGIKFLRLFVKTNSVEICLRRQLIYYTKKQVPEKAPAKLIKTPLFNSASAGNNPAGAPVRIAVILHLHYADLWPELAGFISQIPEAFDLFVTTPAGEFSKNEILIKKSFPAAHVFPVENRGRDILPFLSVLEKISPATYDYICKIHSKKTLGRWWGDGDFWRRSLLCDILGSPEIVADIIRRFDADSRLGMVVAWNNLQKTTPASHDPNRETVRTLAARMDLPDADNYAFPAGSMFWARLAALEPLRAAGVTPEKFPAEQGQNDGTMAHAVERAFGLSVKKSGFYSEETPEILPPAGSLA